MPPKVAAATPAVQKNLVASVRLYKPSESTSNDVLKVRIFSEWLDCCGTSSPLGQGEQLWEIVPEKPLKSSIFQCSFDTVLDSKEKLSKLNCKPGVYAVLLLDSVEGEIVRTTPKVFSYIDCSVFLGSAGKVVADSIKFGEFEMEFSITVEKQFISSNDLIKYEPLTLDLKVLNSYPIQEYEAVNDIIASTYLFGELKFAEGMQSRSMLFFPRKLSDESSQFVNDDESLSSMKNQSANCLPINNKICFLTGLSDQLAQFKEALTSSTFVLEVHTENVSERAFSYDVVTQLNAILGETRAPAAAAAPAAGGKGGKAPPPAAKAPEVGPVTFGGMGAIDNLLLKAIQGALRSSRQLKPHGTVRFRLEQLLTLSNDELVKFSRRRNGAQDGDDEVTVAEDIMLEVKLEKPAKPDRWDLPADMSLRKALKVAETKAAEEKEYEAAMTASLNGTLENTAALSTLSLKKKKAQEAPRCELFSRLETHLVLQAEVRRKLVKDDELNFRAAQSKKKTQEVDFGADSKDSFLSQEQLERQLAVTPFTRMIILLPYLDDDTLWAINDAITAVNSRALPNIQGTMRSYSLTKQEAEESVKGSLDLVSGFMIIDDDMRLVVLEGLAKPDGGMENVFIDLPRKKENDEKLKILCNPQVLFPQRLYPDFCPDLRRIRVRGNLKKLVQKPEIYNRKQVEELCFQGIDSLIALQRAEDLKSTKELDMYPSAESLSKLELLYGEAITRLDMDGTLKKEYIDNHSQSQATRSTRRRDTDSLLSISEKSANMAATGEEGAKRHCPYPKYEPADCRNPDFSASLRARELAPKHDFIAERREQRRQAYRSMLYRRQVREQTYRADVIRILNDPHAFDDGKEPKLYLYSQQSLNFKAKQFNEVRLKAAKDNNATYTFSKVFVSQNICVVDEKEEAVAQKAFEKSQWLTQKGFQYPKTKTRSELITHPKRPTATRIDDLKEPFFDRTDCKPNEGETSDPELRAREKTFKNQIRGTDYFGALVPPEFERPFQLKLVGSETRLPRGKLTSGLEQDPNAFRSVHLGGTEQARIIVEAAAKEKADWRAKVVVDSTDFKIGGFKVRDTVLPIKRADDILKDEPHRDALKHLRNRVSHTGKDLSYTTTPLSLMSREPYKASECRDAMVRVTDTTRFVTADLAKETGLPPKDFVKFIAPGVNDPKIMTVLAKKKHPTQDRGSRECTGPKWESAT